MQEDLISLTEAAAILRMSPEGLRLKLFRNEIPARKIGRRWIVVLSDLVEFIRSGYSNCAETTWGVNVTERRNICHSTKEVISGGSSSLTVENEYNKLLERRIEN